MTALSAPASPAAVQPLTLPGLVARRLWPDPPRLAAPVWVQAVSVGEVEVAATFAAALAELGPGPILVTSTTLAGVALAQRRFAAGTTCPFPLDLPFAVRRFFDRAGPRLLVLVETELWPVVLTEARRREVPVLLVNARLSERSERRYRALPSALRKPLKAITRVAARSPADAERFVSIGLPAERVTATGDLKFDRPAAPEPPFAAEMRALAAGRPTLVAGSLAEEEIEILLRARERVVSERELFVLLAPRRPETFDAVAALLVARGLRVARRSRLSASPARPDVLLLDSVGELGGVYRLGALALLGGTFGTRGGHNVLEPLRAALPTLHGPSVWNVKHVLEAAAGAVFEVRDAATLAVEILRVLGDEGACSRAADVAAKLFERNAGAARAAATAAVELLAARSA